jgi:acetyl esterase/lipase
MAAIFAGVADAQTPTHNDVAYAVVTNENGSMATLRMDVWESTADVERAPLIIWIHGGAWLAGTYNSAPPGLTAMLEAGFAVASIQYRFSTASIFPAQIHDVKGAVRFLRAHSTEYRLDASRFASYGSSAGGHLAALLATSGDVADAEGTTGGNLEFSSHVQAAIDYFGPTDLLNMNLDVTNPPGSIINHDAPDSPESQLIGFDGAGQGIGVLRANFTNPNPPFPENAALVTLVNPITHVDANDPPVFIAHGNQDNLVPQKQSQRLADALNAVGVEHVMRVVVGAGHGFGGQTNTVNAEAIAFVSAQFDRRAGDFDGDGDVDMDDYDLWREDFGTNRAAADGNGDGFIDAADFTVWRDNLPSDVDPGAASATPNPEPSAALLLILGGLMTSLSSSICRRRLH